MNSEAFQRIVDEYTDMVYNLGLNFLNNRQDAEEVTQDVFMKVFTKMESTFRNESSIKTWIYRITVRTCLDKIKSRKSIKNLPLETAVGGSEILDWNAKTIDHPGILLEHKEELETLFRCIDKLPVRQKTVLLLKYVEQLSLADISDITGEKEKTIESLLSRARKNLKEYLLKTKELT